MSTTAPLPDPPAKPGHVAVKATNDVEIPTPAHGNGIPGHGSMMTQGEQRSPPWAVIGEGRGPLPPSFEARLTAKAEDMLRYAAEGRYVPPPEGSLQGSPVYGGPLSTGINVVLNEVDAAAIERDSTEQYRTPAQQIAFIVHTHYTKPAKATPAETAASLLNRSGTAPPFVPRGVPTPPPEPPELELEEGQTIPAYHVGDGSGDDMPFGKGCGKVGVLLTRIIKPGEMIRPGDVLTIHGTPILEGGLMCGGCGQPISPASWSTG